MFKITKRVLSRKAKEVLETEVLNGEYKTAGAAKTAIAKKGLDKSVLSECGTMFTSYAAMDENGNIH